MKEILGICFYLCFGDDGDKNVLVVWLINEGLGLISCLGKCEEFSLSQTLICLDWETSLYLCKKGEYCNHYTKAKGRMCSWNILTVVSLICKLNCGIIYFCKDTLEFQIRASKCKCKLEQFLEKIVKSWVAGKMVQIEKKKKKREKMKQRKDETTGLIYAAASYNKHNIYIFISSENIFKGFSIFGSSHWL